jgi:hypothetical protein
MQNCTSFFQILLIIGQSLKNFRVFVLQAALRRFMATPHKATKLFSGKYGDGVSLYRVRCLFGRALVWFGLFG